MASIDRRIGVYGNAAIKLPCVAATTANLEALAGLLIIDARQLVEGDRVLVKNQDNPVENGVYTADTGTWSRDLDFNGPRDVVQGTQVLIIGGTVAAGMTWEVTTANPVIGTTAIAWERLGLTSSFLLPGWYLVTDYGGDPTGTDDLSLSIQAAHDAMPAGGGTIYVPAGTAWSCRSAVVLSKPCVLQGAGRGITLLNVGATFAASGAVLLKFTGINQGLRDLKILGDITDPTQSYIGVQVDGPASFTYADATVYGCGVGFDFVQGNTGSGYNTTVRYFRDAGMRFGGTAYKYSSEYRFYGGVITNPNSTGVTNGATVSGRVINMADTTGIEVGYGFASQNIPIGTKVASKTATTVTLDADVTGTVPSGRYVRYGLWLTGACVHVRNNTFNANFTDLLIAGGAYLLLSEGAPNIGAGLYRADTIWFNNLNATASAGYRGVYITGGTNFRFNDSWLGDVPFGPTLYASSSTSVAADVSDIHVTNTLVGGGGTYGAYFDYAKNIFFNNAELVGNGQLASNTYPALHCTANARGKFEFIGGHAGYDLIDNATGPSSHGIVLAAGSFAGSLDTVNVNAQLTGLTKGWTDGSAPIYPLKIFNPFGGGRLLVRASPDATQVIGAAAGWVKVDLDTENFDPAGTFASSRWTPITGTYTITASVGLQVATPFQVAIYKNGAIYSQMYSVTRSGIVTDNVQANGTDYFEMFVNIPAGETIEPGSDITFLTGG